MLREFACAVHGLLRQRQIVVIRRQRHPGGGQSAIIVSRVFCAVNSLASQVSRARDRLWFLPNKSSSKLETAPSACEAELRPLATVLLRVWLSSASTVGNSDARVSPYLGARGLDIGQRLLHIAVAVQRDADHFFQPRVIDHFLPVADHRRRFAVRPGQVAGTGAAGDHNAGQADAARGQERDKHKTQTKHTYPEKDVGGEETFHQHEEQRYEEHRQQGGQVRVPPIIPVPIATRLLAPAPAAMASGGTRR